MDRRRVPDDRRVTPAAPSETFRESRPAARLAQHVVCFWVQRVPAGFGSFIQRTVPNGSAELVCTVGAAPRFVGPSTGPMETVVAPGTTVVGVRLRPGAGPAVFGQPVAQFVDETVAADLLHGWLSAALGEASAAARSDQEMVDYLQAYVCGQLDRTSSKDLLDPLVLEVVRRLGGGNAESLRSLAASLYVSERQLRRRVTAATGLGPKTLHRHLRFQRFLAHAAESLHPAGQLAALAAQAGYADQAHLTRESVRLEGRPPHAVLLESEHHCRGAHDHSASYQPLLSRTSLFVEGPSLFPHRTGVRVP